MIREPPVGRIATEGGLDKGHLRPAGIVQTFQALKVHILSGRRHGIVALRRKRLEDHQPSDLSRGDIQPQQRMTEMVEHSHEEHEIVPLRPTGELIDVALLEAYAVFKAELPGAPS